ncbi:hypothetical protein BHM03_00057013 [Ensete ventricosum]|nr:hypothetical protein BHM03_00057013 [Ensete ventricosum]
MAAEKEAVGEQGAVVVGGSSDNAVVCSRGLGLWQEDCALQWEMAGATVMVEEAAVVGLSSQLRKRATTTRNSAGTEMTVRDRCV